MLTSRTETLISRILVEAFNQGNLAIVDELLSPDHLSNSAFGGAPHGPGGMKWLVGMFRTAFPDLRCTVEDEMNVADQFAAHWTMRGSHQGFFMGNAPTGRQVVAHAMSFGRTANGQIVENWTLVDQMGILQQLRIVPPAPGQ